MSDDTIIEPKSHPEARYYQALQLAETSEGKSREELVDIFENALLLGERRGLGGALKFLDTYVTHLRSTYTNGVANHVQQALARLNNWAGSSENFKLWERPEELGKNKAEAKFAPKRKFFGQELQKLNGNDDKKE